MERILIFLNAIKRALINVPADASVNPPSSLEDIQGEDRPYVFNDEDPYVELTEEEHRKIELDWDKYWRTA